MTRAPVVADSLPMTVASRSRSSVSRVGIGGLLRGEPFYRSTAAAGDASGRAASRYRTAARAVGACLAAGVDGAGCLRRGAVGSHGYFGMPARFAMGLDGCLRPPAASPGGTRSGTSHHKMASSMGPIVRMITVVSTCVAPGCLTRGARVWCARHRLLSALWPRRDQD
jgi:hypothetical protein